MRFTIGIPVRNGEEYLKQAIASAVAQTREADEILVLDDASSDRSSQIAHSSEWGRKIQYVYNDNPSGYVDAFNRIAQLAQGDYVAILSCDDLLHENFLFHVERALDTYPQAQHVYCGFQYIDQHGFHIGSSPEPHSLEPALYTGREYSQKYLRSVVADQQIHRFLGVATSRTLLSQCPIRKESGLIADNDFFMRIGAYTDVVGISQPLASVRIHPLSISSRLESITSLLAEDYLFQTRYYTMNTTHLDSDSVRLTFQLAAQFINRFFYEGVYRAREDWIVRAVELHRELNQLVPHLDGNSVQDRERTLQRMANKSSLVLSTLRAYSRVIGSTVRAVKYSRNELRRK